MRPRATIAALLLVVAAVVLVVGLGRGRSPDPTTAPPPPVATTVAPPTAAVSTPAAAPTAPASSDPTSGYPSSLTAEARRRWEPTVRGFGGAFTRTHWPRPKWQAALAPYADAVVRTDLRSYDRKPVPDQRYAGYDVLDAQDSDLAIQVNYADGWAMVLYLHTADQEHWLVHAYDRLEE